MSSDILRELAELLLKKRMTLSLAESCTGGKLAAVITDIPGASEFFLGCAVTYSNASKEKLLKVPHTVLERYGAVSAETAKKMAEGARDAFGSDIAGAITGIAGPGGGTPEKPVGTVFIAAVLGKTTKCEKLELNGSRDEIRNAAAENLIRSLIDLASV